MSRKNISLSQQMEERAQAIIKARGFGGLSDLLAALIREEYERRHPPMLHDAEAPGPQPSASPPAAPVTYRTAKSSSPSKRPRRPTRNLAAEAVAALEKDLKRRTPPK